MPRGGRRQGVKGRRYPERSDLRTVGGPLPLQAPTGQGYGERKAQIDAQRTTPMGTPVVAQPAASAPADYPAPGSLGALDRPTDRPGEPLTAGLATGPGPGPEAMPSWTNPADADLAVFAQYLPTLELMANQPNASIATRNLVRRMRGAVPPGQGVR